MKAFSLETRVFNPSPTAVSPTVFGYLGAGLAISANSDGQNAILWALNGTQFPGSVHACNAITLQEIYNSNQAPDKADTDGGGAQLSVPTIANGKVFVGTHNSLVVFGLKSAASSSITTQTKSLLAAWLRIVAKPFRTANSEATGFGDR